MCGDIMKHEVGWNSHSMLSAPIQQTVRHDNVVADIARDAKLDEEIERRPPSPICIVCVIRGPY